MWWDGVSEKNSLRISPCFSSTGQQTSVFMWKNRGIIPLLDPTRGGGCSSF